MKETSETKNEHYKPDIENNQVTIMGTIVSEFDFSHEIFGEGFWLFNLQVKRQESESIDILPVMISEGLLDVRGDYMGMMVVVNGQFRSYNRHEEHKNKLVLSVYAREIEFVKEISGHSVTNQVFLNGYVCKEPVYRKTPLGREIADLLLAVNRPYGKSDYIPCFCCGRYARYAGGMAVGEQCLVWGSILSREYMKDWEKRIAYEVAVSRFERLQSDE